MATSNFYNKNASRIYGAKIHEEWEHEDLTENVRCDLKADRMNEWEDGLRSYPGKIFASLTSEKQYADLTVTVEIQLIARSGYYDGANLDWNLNIDVEGSNYDAIPEEAEVAKDFEYGAPNLGMAKILGRKAHKWIEKTAEDLIGKTEATFAQYTTPLVVAARFSNGETIYQKV